MAGIQRFVTYLYLYENNDKIRNAGFAKVEIRGGQCRMEIHLKSCDMSNVSAPIYLFSREGEIMHAVEIGRMNFTGGMGDYKALLKNVEIGHSPYNMEDMKGMLIIGSDQTMIASQWDDGEISRENIEIWEPRIEPAKEDKDTKNKDEDANKVISEQHSVNKKTEKNSEEKMMQATEVPMPKIIKGAFPQHPSLEENWELMKSKAQVTYHMEEAGVEGIQIELRDIRELPKRFWYLGNNSFLLHGFFNYRYLMWGKRMVGDKEVMFLGIPGVYQNQERVMATIFGFPEFVIEKPNEKNGEHFGYWCHTMDE